MKIQLDTENKIIRISESINLREFITKVQVLLGDEYKEYTLDIVNINYGYNPIYIPFPDEPIFPNPYYKEYVTTTSTIYNIEMQ